MCRSYTLLKMVRFFHPPYTYTVVHVKCSSLFLAVTVANRNQYLLFFLHYFNEMLHTVIVKLPTSPDYVHALLGKMENSTLTV